MEYGTVIEFLKGQENGEEMVKVVSDRLSSVNSEAKNLRDRLKQFDGVDVDKAKSVLAAMNDLGIDTVETLRGLKSDAEKKHSGDTEVKKMSEQLQQLQKKFDDAVADSKRKDITNQLLAHKERILNPKATIGYHVANGDFQVGEDGKVYYVKGNDLIGIGDGGLDAFLADNPDAARTVSTPGAESGGGGQNGKKTEMTREEFDRDPAAGVKFVSEGGRVVD